VICHTVLWRLHDPADAERFRAELLSCRALVPGLRRYDVGIKQEALPGTVDVALVAWFDDLPALNAYVHHPQHQAVSQRIGPLRRERHVLDFEVPA
jgi:hypothetical protein